MSRGSDPKGPGLPSRLVPYLDRVSWQEAPKPGANPELDAAVTAFKAPDSQLGGDDPPAVQDLARGMGNTSAYVAPVTLPPSQPLGAPVAADKVVLALADVPRVLPAGRPTAETVETRVLRDAGGAAASRWAKDAPAGVAPVELPSALAPSPSPESASGAARSRSKAAAALGIVVAAVAAAVLGGRAFTSGEAPHGGPATAAGATASAIPSAAPAPPAPAPAARAPEPEGSATSTAAPAPAPAPAPSAAPAPERPHAAARAPASSDDPYVDAAVPARPPVTAAPSAIPAPPSVPPPPSAAPKPTASPAPEGDDLIYHRTPRKSP